MTKLLERSGIWTKIQQYKNTPNHSSSIRDIVDGTVYKKFTEPEGFLTSENNLTLLFNTDGIPLYKSSKVNIWPVFLAVRVTLRKGVSTESLLLYLSETWKINVDCGKVIGVIFIDFRKAFDSVDHDILFYKMQACGIYGNLLRWLVSYLDNRKQFVELNGVKSQLNLVSHGVPQGSLLGPRLFSIYVNDFAESISNGELHLYADDTTAFVIGNSVNYLTSYLKKSFTGAV